MNIVVAGQDRGAALGAELRAAAAGRPTARGPRFVAEPISALRLREAESEAGYLAELLRLLRYRDNVDTLPFPIPRRPGPAGALLARLKAALWNFLRYQHDRITGRQNLINHMYSGALEFQHKEIQELRRRVAELERRLADRRGGPAA